MPITPEQVETRLHELGDEIDKAHEDLVKSEMVYHKQKAQFEINMSRARLHVGTNNLKLRVQDVADKALAMCEDDLTNLAIAEATVKAARANAQRVRTQVDIARSIGTSVRSALDI